MPIPMIQPIPAKFLATCAFCNVDLDVRDRGIYQYTHGWVMNRSGGGGHGVSLPKRLPRWSCGHCIERQTKGQLGQSPLF